MIRFEDHLKILELFKSFGANPDDCADLLQSYFVLCLINALDKTGSKTMEIVESPQFVSQLASYQIDSFFEKAGRISLEEINHLRRLLASNNLYKCRDFMDEFFPWLVVNWKEFLAAFSYEQSEGMKLAAIFAVLKYTSKYTSDSPINQLNAVEIYQNNPLLTTLWEEQLKLQVHQFEQCWNAIFSYPLSPIWVQINGNIAGAIKIYRKWYVPLSKLLSDFCDIKRYKKQLESAIDPWKYLNRGIKKVPIEGGLSTDETLFEKAAWKIKDELPSDVIRSAFYPPSRNVSAFECGFLFENFAQIISPDTQVLVVNPSPDFILKCQTDHRFSLKNTHFAVPDETIASLYNGQFTTSAFCAFSQISSLRKMDRILIMWRDCPIDCAEELLSSMSICSDSAEIIATFPAKLFDSQSQKIETCLAHNGCYLRELILLPTAITTRTINRKKALVHISKSSFTSVKSDILLSLAMVDETAIPQKLWFSKELRRVSYDDFYFSNRTLLSNYEHAGQTAVASETTHRNRAECYYFSKEIHILYTVQADRKNRYAAKAYYCASLRDGEHRQQGKRLTKNIEKGLRAQTKSDILSRMEYVPFDQRVDAAIVGDILEVYASTRDSLSLKTVWFCCRGTLLKSLQYDENVAKDFFCGESQTLSNLIPAVAWESDFIHGMEQRFGCASDQISLKHWKQLDMILGVAIQEHFIRYNPLSSFVRSLSSAATDAQREVRNALVKKTFTLEEEEKIIAFLCAETRTTFGTRLAKRYETESVYLAGAIRLFTGMAVREVCGLTWGDLLYAQELNAYRFAITKFITPEGETVTTPTQKNWKLFRMIPIPTILASMLISRKQYLMQACKLTEAKLKTFPIVLQKEPAMKITDVPVSFCKPRYLAEKCRKLISVAEIPEQILILPDEERQIETDIFKYQGDIFQSNFRYRANHICKLTRGEISYILGIEPPDTFSRHYCDYTNDFIQLGMAQKLQRWTVLHPLLNRFDAVPTFQTIPSVLQRNDQFGPFPGGVSSVDIVWEISQAYADELLFLSVDTDFGYKGNMIFYEKEEAVYDM